jgi:hypothetical protein
LLGSTGVTNAVQGSIIYIAASSGVVSIQGATCGGFAVKYVVEGEFV